MQMWFYSSITIIIHIVQRTKNCINANKTFMYSVYYMCRARRIILPPDRDTMRQFIFEFEDRDDDDEDMLSFLFSIEDFFRSNTNNANESIENNTKAWGASIMIYHIRKGRAAALLLNTLLLSPTTLEHSIVYNKI